MSLIRIQNLSFTYAGASEPVFENVSFQIDTAWKLGLTGRNGRGKTTLLRLLAGDYEYRGTISSGVNFEYFPYPVDDPGRDTLAVLEEAAQGAEPWALRRELNLLGVPEDALCRPFETLSGGERLKALLAALFLRENTFPLIDEPTNHLDLEGRRRVGDYLHGKDGFLLVSHDRAFLDRCVDHMLSLQRNCIEIQKGNFSSWYRNKELRDQSELRENETLRRDIARLQEAAARAGSWSGQAERAKFQPQRSGLKPDRGYLGHKSAKLMQRSKQIEARRDAAAEDKSKLLKNIERTEALRLQPLPCQREPLVTLKDVSVFFGSRMICEGFNLVINSGDRIALQGGNGTGKSSILKLVCGENIPFSGEVRRGANLMVSDVPQDVSFLSGTVASFAAEHGLDDPLFRAILRKLDLSRAQFDLDMRFYSEGQKKKVLLAKSIAERAHLYIWDEPLNFIDVFSRIQIEQLLLASGCTLLFAEHDAAFTDAVATKRLCLAGGHG